MLIISIPLHALLTSSSNSYAYLPLSVCILFTISTGYNLKPDCVSGKEIDVCTLNQKFENLFAKVFPSGILLAFRFLAPIIMAFGCFSDEAIKEEISLGLC